MPTNLPAAARNGLLCPSFRILRPRLLTAAALVVASTSLHAQSGLTPAEATETEWYVEPLLNVVITRESFSGSNFPFSPDGKRSFYITRKADIATDRNVYRLYLVERAGDAAVPMVRQLTVATSAGNKPGIGQVRWIGNHRIAFVAQDDAGDPQVYSVDLQGARTQHTADRFDKLGFALGPDGMLVYGAVTPFGMEEADRRNGYVIGNRTLTEVLNIGGVDWRRRIRYRLVQGGVSTEIKGLESPFSAFPPFISISPSGRYVALATAPESIPASWASMQYAFKSETGSPAHSLHQALKLIDLRNNQISALGGGPMAEAVNRLQLIWDEPRQRVIALDQFIVASPSDRLTADADLSRAWTFEYSLASKSISGLISQSPIQTGSSRNNLVVDAMLTGDRLEIMRQTDGATFDRASGPWRLASRRDTGGEKNRAFKLALDQALDRQPQLMVSTEASQTPLPLGDVLNPVTRSKMIPARLYAWTDKDGKAWEGGLILPPGKTMSDRLPLIIQSHTFRPGEFIVTGTSSSTAGFAAQAFARAGFAVITTGYRKGERLGEAGEFEIASEGLRSLVKDMAEKGVIDPARVGIVAWSRSGFWLQHALAFQDDLFAAAYAADVSSFGLFSYLFFENWGPHQADYIMQNGSPPFGDGRKNWTDKDPVTVGNRFGVPLRIDKYGPSMPSWWETYAAMRSAKQPVEYFHVPTSVHVPITPRHQLLNQNSSVDWFRFWLLGDRNPAPQLADQYDRWAMLCRLRVTALKKRDATRMVTAIPCQKAI